jgi:hypothetical protein
MAPPDAPGVADVNGGRNPGTVFEQLQSKMSRSGVKG